MLRFLVRSRLRLQLGELQPRLHPHVCYEKLHKCVQLQGILRELGEGNTGTMPRANVLRVAGPRALTRKTSEREKAQVLQDVIGLWNQESGVKFVGPHDVVAFAKWLAGHASSW